MGVPTATRHAVPGSLTAAARMAAAAFPGHARSRLTRPYFERLSGLGAAVANDRDASGAACTARESAALSTLPR